jgi:predicted Zn-dependent protease
MSNIDIVAGRNRIVQALARAGFTQSASDPSDYQQGTSRALRFKVGTQYGEVTMTVWNYSRQIGVHRAISDAQIDDLIRVIGQRLEEAAERQRVPISEYDR